jgi:hypothetical protein
MCVVLILWLVVIAIHYLRSPQAKPTVPYAYDRQLNIHQTIMFSLLFVASLIAILAPESVFQEKKVACSIPWSYARALDNFSTEEYVTSSVLGQGVFVSPSLTLVIGANIF